MDDHDHDDERRHTDGADAHAPGHDHGHPHVRAMTPPVPVAPRRLADGVLELDTMLGGWSRVTAGYLLEGPRPVLVETGSQSSVPTLLAALDAIGIGADDLAGVVVTHIHLDHAGGVGDVAAAFPNATVYVHEKGARHLADPSRLVASAALVYGDLLDSLYGRLTADARGPAPRARGPRGDRPRRRAHADRHRLAGPRQAPPRPARLVVGHPVRRRRRRRAAPRHRRPPASDARRRTSTSYQARDSLRRFAERRPSGVALAHYGLLEDPPALLAEADEVLVHWAEVAEAAWRGGDDIADALSDGLRADRRRPGAP